MIKQGQIRKFKDGELPDIKVNHFIKDTQKWFCIFQEDFKYPYISLTEKQIEHETVLIKKQEPPCAECIEKPCQLLDSSPRCAKYRKWEKKLFRKEK